MACRQANLAFVPCVSFLVTRAFLYATVATPNLPLSAHPYPGFRNARPLFQVRQPPSLHTTVLTQIHGHSLSPSSKIARRRVATKFTCHIFLASVLPAVT